MYPKANKKAAKSYTDDMNYTVDRGKFDIYNFSRAPQGDNKELQKTFIYGNKLKYMTNDIMKNGTINHLHTSNPEIFAYTNSIKDKFILVVGNLNFNNKNAVKLQIPIFKPKTQTITPINISSEPKFTGNKLEMTLQKGEVMVILFRDNDIE